MPCHVRKHEPPASVFLTSELSHEYPKQKTDLHPLSSRKVKITSERIDCNNSCAEKKNPDRSTFGNASADQKKKQTITRLLCKFGVTCYKVCSHGILLTTRRLPRPTAKVHWSRAVHFELLD